MANNYGWTPMPHEINRMMAMMPYPRISDAYSNIKGSSTGKARSLVPIVKEVMGKMYLLNQGSLGSCVSFGTMGAASTLLCVESKLGKINPIKSLVAPEPIYGGSRVQILNGQLGYGDGSIGLAAANWLNEYCILLQENYSDLGIDLTHYDIERCRKWGNPGQGCPQALIEKGKGKIIKYVCQVNTFQEACDCIESGYTIIVCSNRLYSQVRDGKGFSYYNQNGGHCQHIIGYINKGNNPGLLVVNSWSDYYTGGVSDEIEMPQTSSYLIRPEDANAMFSEGDSWVLISSEGMELRDLDLRIV
jgi:hypothetical protein